MVETLTDNRNRTAANMRHYFDKFGGNLGQMGCVSFMFTQKGVIVVDLEDKDPDQLMMDALDAGADDFDAGEDAAEVVTSPENFTAVCEALEKKGYTFVSADVAMVPSTTTLTDPDQLVQMGQLLDALDDDDYVPERNSLENEEDLDCQKRPEESEVTAALFSFNAAMLKRRPPCRNRLPTPGLFPAGPLRGKLPPPGRSAGEPQPGGRPAAGHPAGGQVHHRHLFERDGDGLVCRGILNEEKKFVLIKVFSPLPFATAAAPRAR